MNKEIKQALIDLGFTDKDPYFELRGYRIKIYNDTTLEEVFSQLIKCGETLKVWEIQNVLGIV